MTEMDWKYVDVKLKSGKIRQMKMGSKLRNEEIGGYSELVEHRIPLVPGAKLVRQKEIRMNPQLQLLVKVELERFIKPVEFTNWVSPMVIVKKKNGKLRVCVDYRKLNACTQKDHFSLPFITLLLEEVGGHARYTFMDGYARYNQIAIALGDVHKTTFTTLLGDFRVAGDAIRAVQCPDDLSTTGHVYLHRLAVQINDGLH